MNFDSGTLESSLRFFAIRLFEKTNYSTDIVKHMHMMIRRKETIEKAAFRRKLPVVHHKLALKDSNSEIFKTGASSTRIILSPEYILKDHWNVTAADICECIFRSFGIQNVPPEFEFWEKCKTSGSAYLEKSNMTLRCLRNYKKKHQQFDMSATRFDKVKFVDKNDRERYGEIKTFVRVYHPCMLANHFFRTNGHRDIAIIRLMIPLDEMPLAYRPGLTLQDSTVPEKHGLKRYVWAKNVNENAIRQSVPIARRSTSSTFVLEAVDLENITERHHFVDDFGYGKEGNSNFIPKALTLEQVFIHNPYVFRKE